MNHLKIKGILCDIGLKVCERTHQSLHQQSAEQRASVHKEGIDDTIYQIDKDVEDIIVPLLEKEAEGIGGILLVAEGIGEEEENGVVLPSGINPEEAAIKIIMDPIDGTRGIMYDKRAAFFLAGVATNRGKENTINDIEVAVMVELPTSRSVLSDTLWAIKGEGAFAFTKNLESGVVSETRLQPSVSKSIYGGFAQIARFFPPGRQTLAAIEEELIETIFPDAPEGKAIVFEDQYISSGGQMYELLVGHDRFIADVRTALFAKMKREGKKAGHVCHPYDMCAILIAREAGVIVTDIEGNFWNAPMDTTTSVDWIGYANKDIQKEIEEVLQRILRKYELIE